jgi:HSP20 family molecular chaperone IbpA
MSLEAPMIVRHRSPFAVSPFAAPFARSPLARVTSPVDRTLEQLAASLGDARRRAPVVDATWRDGTLTLTVDLPGVPAGAVDVEITGRTLTLGVRTDELTWSRSLTLGASLDTETVAARHVDGRLTVTVEPVATPAARRIEIDTTATRAIDATPEDEGAGPIDVTVADDIDTTVADDVDGGDHTDAA